MSVDQKKVDGLPEEQELSMEELERVAGGIIIIGGNTTLTADKFNTAIKLTSIALIDEQYNLKG